MLRLLLLNAADLFQIDYLYYLFLCTAANAHMAHPHSAVPRDMISIPLVV